MKIREENETGSKSKRKDCVLFEQLKQISEDQVSKSAAG